LKFVLKFENRNENFARLHSFSDRFDFDGARIGVGILVPSDRASGAAGRFLPPTLMTISPSPCRYGQWREMAKVDPAMARMMGFKDNPKRRDDESLSLKMETVPEWMPGTSMRGATGRHA
jgi:hypothetical protein